MDASKKKSYCLAHGLLTLHVKTELLEETFPVALFQDTVGEEALRLAGPRAQRVVRWDAAGWKTWWDLLAFFSGDCPVIAVLPSLEPAGVVPPSIPGAYTIPPPVALRAATPLLQGTALYLGAFGWEVAAFGPHGVDEARVIPPGLEPLYRSTIAAFFQNEHRPLLPPQVPALWKQGFTPDVTALLGDIEPLLDGSPLVLGGEDDAVVQAVAAALQERGHTASVVDPLAGAERLVRAIGGLS